MRAANQGSVAPEVEGATTRPSPAAGPQRYWLVTWQNGQPLSCQVAFAGQVLKVYVASTDAAADAAASCIGGMARSLSATEFVYKLLRGWADDDAAGVVIFTPAAAWSGRTYPPVIWFKQLLPKAGVAGQSACRELLLTVADGQHRVRRLFDSGSYSPSVQAVIEKAVPLLAATVRALDTEPRGA